MTNKTFQERRVEMRLINISGRIWELSQLQRAYTTDYRNTDIDVANNRVIAGKNVSDVCRVLSGYGVRSKATATIEIIVNGLPSQNVYDIYISKKGFYCNVQGKRRYLTEFPAPKPQKEGGNDR